MITRAKLSAVRASGVRRLFEGGAYSRAALINFFVPDAALIRGRRLFKHCTRQIYFFYIFIQQYTFYLLIFLWTDTKLIVNLELREKFTRWKKNREFTITRAKLSAVRASGVRRLFEGGAC